LMLSKRCTRSKLSMELKSHKYLKKENSYGMQLLNVDTSTEVKFASWLVDVSKRISLMFQVSN